MTDDDSTLIDQIKCGDADALAQFIELRRSQLTGYIEKNLGASLRKKIEAEDLFQEVSADCCRALSDVEIGDRDPFGWLCQMAQRKIVDAHRFFFDAQKRDASQEIGLDANKTGQAGLVNLLVASITSPSAAFSRSQKEVRIQEAIGQLPENHREVIRLRYVEGLPTRDIAQQLGKTDGSIRVIISRTLKKLQDLLGVDGSEIS
ncbi:MAG: RNA polymerase sigma-70 factor (ECF subfamily) [Mariniblastus sp.]|jgi:RNA polymerase sigma-70 factor (ECF subfamily)